MSSSNLNFARNVVGASSRSSAFSDWSGVAKLAAVTAALVGGYFVYRHVVVIGGTARGALDAASGES